MNLPEWMTRHTMIDDSDLHVAIDRAHVDEAESLLGSIFTVRTNAGREVEAELIGVRSSPTVYLRPVGPRTLLNFRELEHALNVERERVRTLTARHEALQQELIAAKRDLAEVHAALDPEQRARLSANLIRELDELERRAGVIRAVLAGGAS